MTNIFMPVPQGITSQNQGTRETDFHIREVFKKANVQKLCHAYQSTQPVFCIAVRATFFCLSSLDLCTGRCEPPLSFYSVTHTPYFFPIPLRY